MPTVLKIGVVGTGKRACSHLTTILKLKDVYKLVAVCDINETRVRNVSKKFNAKGYTNVEKMLNKENIDVILIATPPEGHHIITTLAAEYGVHVICETPMSFSLECARMMLDVCRKHGTKINISENVFRWPSEKMKKCIVESGIIGKITQIHCCYVSGMYHGISAIRNCASSEAKRVIGFCKNVYVAEKYWFDPYCYRAGKKIKNIDLVSTKRKEKIREVPWEIGVTEYENEVISIHEFPIGSLRGSHWEIDATLGYIIGNDLYMYENGKYNRYSIQTEMCTIEEGTTIDYLKVGTKSEIIWENPHKEYPLAGADEIARAEVLINTHKAIVENTETDYAIDGYKDLEIMIATRESAIRGGVPIELPIKEPLKYDGIQHEKYREMYGQDCFKSTHIISWKQEAELSNIYSQTN